MLSGNPVGMIICCSRGFQPAVYDSPGMESRGDDPYIIKMYAPNLRFSLLIIR